MARDSASLRCSLGHAILAQEPLLACGYWLARRLSRCHLTTVCLWLAVLEKSEFKDESQYFRFHADEEMEGTSSKNKQLRNDFKLVENILAKRLLVGAREGCCAVRP